MPYVDTYGTQSPIALIRCQMDWGLWYDAEESDPNRKKKFIRDVQYVAAMNNKAGSFTINSRLMTHFFTFSMNDPSRDDLCAIFKSILDGHLFHFEKDIQDLSGNVVDATVELLQHLSRSPQFKPNTFKFHYQFNFRDISNVFQGLVRSAAGVLDKTAFSRLWIHETRRVFSDRLVNDQDIEAYNGVVKDLCKKHLQVDQTKLLQEPVIFTNFVESTESGVFTDYKPCEDYAALTTSLERVLLDYNENNAAMDLVLFDMAVDHVSRISRIIGNPRGNALLIGVGGSGKQSLTRLASWICGYEVFQIQVTRHYGIPELLEDLKALYMKAGVKGQGVTFLFTDSQIVDEKWLVYINDILSSGEIPQLFTDEEKDSIFQTLRNEAKSKFVDIDSRVAMNEFFINKVQRNLHLVLCMSPVGDAFRIRCRKFPAIINCTSLDWFFSWPRDALCKVSDRFLDCDELDIEIELRQNIAHHMAEVHLSVNKASEDYLHIAKRFNYTTPKSFLELIAFYKKLYKQRSGELYEEIQRLEKGIATLQKTGKDVASLKEDLNQKLVIVAEKEEAAKLLIAKIAKEKIQVDKEKEKPKKKQNLPTLYWSDAKQSMRSVRWFWERLCLL
eukprot:UN25456